MDSDALIEQLAFGKTTPKLSSCLGIYLSPETVYLCEVRMQKGRPVIDHLVRVPLPAPSAKPGQAPGATTLNADFLSDAPKLVALIRQAMSQSRWNSRNVIVTLSHHLGLLRYFTMPRIDRRFWGLSVPLEAKKYIPIPFDALSHDYQVVELGPGADGKPRQGALIAVAPGKNIVNLQALLEGLGLTLLAVEVAPCSVMRLWDVLESAKRRDPYCQVHFDGGNVRILIADKGVPVFFREIFLGPEASPQDSRKIDVAGSVSFVQKQLNVAKLAHLRVSGAANELAQWQEQVSQESGMPATFQDVPAQLGVKGGDWGGYAAIGAALRFLAPSVLTIDLSNTGRISDAEKRTARDIFLIAAALSLVLIAVGLARNSVYSYRARDFAKYKRQSDVTNMMMNKKPEEIEKLIRDMQEQADLMQVMDPATRVKATAVLKDIVSCLPEKMWLSRITLSMPLATQSARNLQLVGNVTGASMVEEQDMAFQFRDKLSRTPLVGRLFTDLQISIQNSPVTPESLREATQDVVKKKLEQRTQFTIIGRLRK